MKQYSYAHIFQPRLISDEALRDGLERNLDSLEEIFLAAKNKASEIEASEDLTKAGKVGSLKKLGEAVRKELDEWRGNFHYDTMIEQLEAELIPSRSRPDDFVAELRMREIRDDLRSLDPLEQESRYRDAAESGDDTFLEAIERSPVPIKIATQSLIDKIKIQRLERQYPEQAQKIHDLRRTEEQIDSALSSVRAELRKASIETRRMDLSDA